MKWLVLFTFFLTFTVCAARENSYDCVDCTGKLNQTVRPNIATALNLKKDIAQPKGISRGLTSVSPIEMNPKQYIDGCLGKGIDCYKWSMCYKFLNAKDKYDIEEMFDAIPAMKEHNKIEEYFFMVECSPTNYNQNIGIKAPMIHLIIDQPTKREEFLESIWDSFDLLETPETFTKILNLESTRGETFLDYLYYVRVKGESYLTANSKKSYEKMFKFACSKGATFSKFKNEMNCHKPLMGK